MNLLPIATIPVDISELLAETVLDLASGDLICVGGHQAWPAPPSSHAVRSIALCRVLADKAGAVQTLAFFDDIGAGAACAGAICSATAAGGGSQSLEELPGLDNWCQEHLPTIALSLARRQAIPHLSIEALRELCAVTDDRPAVCERILRLSSGAESEHLIAAIELLVYAGARKHFAPLQLIAASGVEPVPALLERSMNNGASRVLHKLLRNGVPTRLRLEQEETGEIRYQVDLPPSVGGTLLLRREQEHAGRMKASNFCGALLAQLFFTLCRPSRAVATSAERTIMYLIPCYDRVRVRQGMHAFFEIFCDLRHWFGLDRVTLVSVWETGSHRVPFALDSVSATIGDPRPNYRPAFVMNGRSA